MILELFRGLGDLGPKLGVSGANGGGFLAKVGEKPIQKGDDGTAQVRSRGF